MNATILSIGDELTLGQTVDTNSAWLSARLVEHGILTRQHLTVADDQAAIADAIRRAAADAEWVLVTGGLGPTQDDLTRQALADVLGTALVPDPASLERLEGFFKKIGRVMTPNNRIQAMCPQGAEMLLNPRGTAPGLKARIGRATVMVFPGVPFEMKAMFDLHAVPLIVAQSGRVIRTLKINTFGLGESMVGEKLGELMNRDRNPTVGTTVSAGIVAVRIRSESATAGQAQSELDATAAEVRARLGDVVFGEGDATLVEVVGPLLKARGLTVATAESCTGGLVAKLLTDLPGSSAWFLGGWVVYDNRLKQDQLGVPTAMLAEHGAVSEPVARHMAEAALAKSGADCALALTGIAGPDGGTAEKPVGTVWIALARRDGAAIRTRAERLNAFGDRDMVRDRAAKAALNMLRMDLEECGDR